MTDSTTKALLILGSGRNGSTILANILGSATGMANLGEVHWIWDRGLGENRPCGCGERFRDCPFWEETLHKIADVEPTGSFERAALRHATLEGAAPLRLIGRRWARRATERQRGYLRLTERLYRAAAETADARVVVDSSKRPIYGHALTRLEHLDVFVVHLVRDARAVAFSWRRKKANPDRPDGGFMRRYPAWKSALGWAVWNTLTELFNRRSPERYLRIRYEDFARDPRPVLASIGEFIGEDAKAPFSGPHDIAVSVSHSISGNPSRFTTGTVTVSEDKEWMTAMTRADRWITTLLTWPLLARYRYRLRARG